jgi:predicted ester cyclase
MTQKTDTILHRYLRAADAGELDRFAEFLLDDVVVHAPLGLSSNGIAHEQQVWRDALAAIDDLRHDIVDVIVEDERIAARAVASGTMNGKFAGIDASGKSFRIDQAWIVHLRAERISEIWEITDTGALFEQLGVRR